MFLPKSFSDLLNALHDIITNYDISPDLCVYSALNDFGGDCVY